MNETGRVPIKFETGGISVNLDQKRKVNLYRIAQEGITNAIKHARATEISVRLEGKPAAIQLSIRDNGKGINPSLDDRSHNGLINIRERAEILEGKLSIDSNPQKGTLIVIDAPIQLN
jgi:two-component system sensor histidine kinase DegS